MPFSLAMNILLTFLSLSMHMELLRMGLVFNLTLEVKLIVSAIGFVLI